MNIAIIRNGVVENIIVAELGPDLRIPAGTSAVEATADAAIGGTYANGAFLWPIEQPPPPPPPKSTMTLSEFKARLTSQEKLDLAKLAFGGALSDADKALMFDFMTATTLSFGDPKLAQGLARLRALDVIKSDARVAELASP